MSNREELARTAESLDEVKRRHLEALVLLVPLARAVAGGDHELAPLAAYVLKKIDAASGAMEAENVAAEAVIAEAEASG